MDLSILIPSRNEMFLAKTIENILTNIRGDTEIIVVCDGNWPDPAVEDDPRVTLVYHSQAIGQRAATNEAAKLSTAQFIMKCDAHCAFDEGFDVKLMADCEPDWTVIPRMYNLHAFDWQCQKCEHRTYQGPRPTDCEKCDNTTDFEMVIVWEPRRTRRTDFARFDTDLHFQYWRAYGKRPEAQGDISDVMCSVGACWFMHRDRFWELGGLDEAHGSWGQMGVEVACKSWLSGGRQVVNKKTWFAHMFRTQPGFGFPYPNPGIRKARQYSRRLWMENKWPKAKHKLSWLIDKFAPVPDWARSKGLVYYTDNRLDEKIFKATQQQIERGRNGYELVSVSLKPVEFGQNITLDRERGYLTMFKQILAGLEACEADIIFLVEHDVLYHPSHFEFMPSKEDVFYYNENTWKVDASSGQALFYYTKQTSGLCAYRSLLLEHYRKRVELVEKNGFSRKMGFEPGSHGRKERVDDYKAERWMSEYPNVDIRHKQNLTPSRWRQDQFRNQRYCQGWTMADEVPGWGQTKGRFAEFLSEVGG
jgi:glycosyltransferase involved in cell wall biosynthesis